VITMHAVVASMPKQRVPVNWLVPTHGLTSLQLRQFGA
jgi:hypothetical protein